MPFLVLVLAAAFIAPLALSGWSFSTQALAFKWEKLDPIKGIQRVFSWNGVMELGKALAKFTLITGATVLMLWLGMDEYLSVNAESLQPAMAHGCGAGDYRVCPTQCGHHRDCVSGCPRFSFGTTHGG